MCAEAKLSEDVGWDEFAPEACLCSFLNESYSFSLTDPLTKALKGFIMVIPSRYARLETPILAELALFCTPKIKNSISKFLLPICLDIAADLGYEVGTQSAPSCCMRCLNAPFHEPKNHTDERKTLSTNVN